MRLSQAQILRNQKYEDRYGKQEEIEAEIERNAAQLYKEKKQAKIEGFTGYFEYLANDFASECYYRGHIYQNASYAYHAARAPDEKMRNIIHKSPTLSSMYEIAKTFDDPKDWPFRRLKIMEAIIRDKFRRKRQLREKLQATGDREIINISEENTENGLFWGICKGEGQNQLGRILEQIRKDINDDMEIEQWLYTSFSLMEDRNALPLVKMEITKEGKSVETLTFQNKSFYLIGALSKKCDYLMSHPSISRLHACICHDQDSGTILLDLGSKAGTTLNGERLKICFPYQLKNDNIILFGQSSRKHKISIDYAAVEKKFLSDQRNLEKELQLLKKLDDPNLDMETLKATLGLVKMDTVYVGNLAYSVDKRDLEESFKDCGKIKNVRIPGEHGLGKKRGYAFITFETEAGATQAVRHSGMILYDRTIKVSIAEKKPEIEERIKRELEEEKKQGESKELSHREYLKRYKKKKEKNRRGDSEEEEHHHYHHRRERSRSHSEKESDKSEHEKKSSSESESSEEEKSSGSSSFLSSGDDESSSKKMKKEKSEKTEKKEGCKEK